MTTIQKRPLRSNQQYRRPPVQVARRNLVAPSKQSSRPKLHDRDPRPQVRPAPVEVPALLQPPQHITPALPQPSMHALDELIDTRKLSLAELDRLQQAITSRDAAMKERQQIIECQRRGVSKLDRSIATKQRTIDNQRKPLADLHIVLEQVRKDNKDFQDGLDNAQEISAAASADKRHFKQKLTAEASGGDVQAQNRLPFHGVIGHSELDESLTQETHSRLVDDRADISGLHKEIATREEEYQATLADFQQRVCLMEDQLEEANAVIIVSKAKLPVLLEKCKLVDQLLEDVRARDTTIGKLNFLLGDSRKSASTQPAALDRQTSVHDVVVQGYIKQIRDLTAQKGARDLKADEAVALGRRIVDALFAKIP